MRSSVWSASACVLLSVVVACGSDKKSADFDGYGDGTSKVNIDSEEGSHSSGGSSWTVLVYMVADNNLEPFGLLDLEEMMGVGSNDNFHIVAEVDRVPGYSADPIGGVANFTGTKRFLVQKGSLEELDDLGELNTGDPKNLADFITWGAQAYPADKYGIILWDHGSAWPGFGADETSNYDGLTLPELATAFHDGIAATDIGTFNFIGFDACLMGSLETALALRPFGEYLIGSEELEPGHGWDYSAFARAASTPSTGTIDFGKALIDGFRSQAASADWDDAETITLSLIDLYNLKAIERALRDLDGAYADDDAAAIARQRQLALEFGAQANPQDSAGMIDLALFAQSLAKNVSALSSAANALNNASKASVVYDIAGSALASATGLSAYWPQYAAYYNNDYDKLTQMTYWRTFLESVQATTGAVSGGIVFVAGQSIEPIDAGDGSYGFFAELEESSLPAVVAEGIYYGLGDGSGGALLLGDYSGYLTQPNDGTGFPAGVVAFWDFSFLGMTQDSLAQPVYYSFQATNDGGAIGSIPFTYVSASGDAQDAMYVTVFDSNSKVVQQTFYAITQAGYGELTAEAGSKIYPVYIQVDGGSMYFVSSTTFSGSSDYAFDLTSSSPLELDFYGMDGLTSYVFLYAQDASGGLYGLTWEGEAP